MKGKFSTHFLAALVTFALVLTACKRTDFSKIDFGSLNPELAVPIGTARFNVVDVLAAKDSSNLITIDGQGALKLVYATELEILNVADLVQLENQDVAYNKTALEYGIGPSPTGFFGSTTVLVDETFDFTSQNGEKLYSITFQDGKLVVSVSTDLQHEVRFDLDFPDITIGGVPASVSLELNNPQPGQTQSDSDSVDLTNAIFDLDNGPQGFNQFQITGSITVTGTGDPITGTESVDFELGMNQLSFEVITADFGQQAIDNYQDTIDLNVFNNFLEGTVEFTNPTINFEVYNSFGIPLQVALNEIKTVENSGTEYSLISSAMSFNVAPAASPGATAISGLTLDETNTQNLGTIISPAPKKLVIDFGGGINPAGAATNFVVNDSELYLEANVDLPLEGYATGFVIQDTIPFSLELPNEISEAMFRLVINNGFPVELGAKLYLADENYTILGELNTDGNLIEGAPVNSNGRVTTSVKKISDIVLSEADADRLSDTRYIIVETSCQTTNGQQGTEVKFYDDYEIEVKLAAQIVGAF